MSLLGIRIILNSRCIRFHLKAPESSFQFPWHSVHCLHFTLYSRPGSLLSWACGPKVTTVLGVWADGHYRPGCVGRWSLRSWVCGPMVTTVLGVWADGHYGPGCVDWWSQQSWVCGLMVSWSWVCEPVVTMVLGVWGGGHYGPGHVGCVFGASMWDLRGALLRATTS